MKRIILFIVAGLLTISCTYDENTKARKVIEKYLESKGYDCKVISVEWEGDRYRIYWDLTYKRLRDRKEAAWKEYIYASDTELESEYERKHKEAKSNFDNYVSQMGYDEYEEYNYYSCIVKCSDYQMKKDIERLYYFIDKDFKKVQETEDQWRW